MAEVLTGTMLRDNGKFAFIQQDNGQPDMFALPIEGGFLPEGTRVAYTVVTDGKTGRPRADSIEPMDGEQVSQSQPEVDREFEQMLAATSGGSSIGGDRATGVVIQHKANFGFIKQDNGEPDMFMLPREGQLIPIGTRVSYDVVTDSKTGRPRAEAVDFLDGHGGAASFAPRGVVVPTSAHRAPAHHVPAHHVPAHHVPAPVPRRQAPLGMAGTVFQIQANFGFIKQDSGEADMFVLHPSCGAFGGQIPVIGTRVNYEVVIDAKTGRPRAENVRPEVVDVRAVYGEAPRKGGGFSKGGAGKGGYVPSSVPAGHAGTILQINANFGFIKPDDGSADMFVIHPSCPAFAHKIPPVGTRVMYDVVVDSKTGRPRAEDVRPEVASYGPAKGKFGPKGGGKGAAKAAVPYAPRPSPIYQPPPSGGGEICTGTMDKNSGKFGFIKQDSGEPDMFILPDLSGGFPPLGARLQYEVITDPKTGRPRAEHVQMLDG